MSLNIVLTGASRGLGRAWTNGFAAAGHIVIGCTRSQTACEELARDFPAPHRFAVVDVRREEQVCRWAQQVLDEAGPPDLLINNAAVMGPTTKLWQADIAQFEECIDINIKGVFYVLKHFVPAMVARGKGVIVNLSSGWGRSTSPEVATYCATKYAIEGMTQALAQELPEGMAAVPLNPGIINTEMLQAAFGKDGAACYPTPEQWAAQAVPYVLSLSAKDNGRPRTVPH
jgi:NAD(P)-dependent dehydrogenase (short-subunit alcohol dehydrogenase family)